MRSHKRFGARIGRAVSRFSLLLLLTAFVGGGTAFGIDYGDVAAKLRAAPNEQAKRKILQDVYDSPDIDAELEGSLEGLLDGESYGITLRQAERMIETRAFVESASKRTTDDSAAKLAADIKRDPLYRDSGEKEESNWMGRGFQKAGESVGGWLERLLGSMSPNVPQVGDMSGVGDVVRVILWLLLVAAVGFILYLAFRHFAWRSNLERKTRALLEDDEPELSRDEYLEEADRLVAQGEFRRAVRCLYLACLLAFDEHRVARFIRGQTNWEHLRRIQASDTLPSDLDFVPATQSFDQVWYGMHVHGLSDVEKMRGWYLEIVDRLRKKVAA